MESCNNKNEGPLFILLWNYMLIRFLDNYIYIHCLIWISSNFYRFAFNRILIFFYIFSSISYRLILTCVYKHVILYIYTWLCKKNIYTNNKHQQNDRYDTNTTHDFAFLVEPWLNKQTKKTINLYYPPPSPPTIHTTNK